MSTLTIPGSEFDVSEHAANTVGGVLRIAAMYGVMVPVTSGPRCGSLSPSGWKCTRASGHKRRCHATFDAGLLNGRVFAVWHQHDW